MRRALLIGVAQYDQYDAAIARAVLGDLTAITTQLKGLGWGVAKVLGEGGAAVGKHDIEAAVAGVLREATEDDDVLVYFSGHGRRRAGVDHLVPTEARVAPPLGSPFDDLVALSAFDTVRDASPARSVTWVVDACRDGPGAADDPTAAPSDPDANKAVTVLFGSSAGQPAGTDDDMSIFTRALLTAIARLGDDARLPTVAAAVQEEVDRLSGGAGGQRVDFVGNTSGRSAPFPLFSIGIPPTATTTWTGCIEAGKRELWPDEERLARILEVVDRIETAAPDLVAVAGADTWAEPTLPKRLAWALGYVALRAELSPDEALVLLGCVAVAEAGFRRAELDLLSQDATPRMEAILGSAPQLREALRADADRPDGPVRAWVAHLAAPSHCVVNDAARLKADLAEVLRAVVPPDPTETSARVARRVGYLVDCIATGFDDSRLRTELDEGTWLDSAWTCRLNGRRLAAAIELTWSLALDTRLCSPGFGPQLLTEPEETSAVLAALGDVRWREDRNVLSLALECGSPVLDHELRQRVESLTAQLLRDTQPDGALHGTRMPVAATASKLEPVGHRYRVPHVTFALSTAEMYSLLMGARFYGDRLLAVRELYQNAVDACLYRERHEQRAGVEPEPPEIEFRLHEVDGVRVLDCLDNGIGMSHHELSHAFAKIGGRFRDLPEYLEEQATWSAEDRAKFHPISQFGIGVLAYFMIADRVELWTVRRYADGSRFHPGLHVEIPGGADLFRVHEDPPAQWMPRATGTRVRFHLKADVSAADIRAVLARTIRAPRVAVRLRDDGAPHDHVWSPGVLYGDSGIPRERCLARPDLGVYFHEGRGEILVNGIPVDPAPAFRTATTWQSSELGFRRPASRKNWEEGPRGCTLSLDGRARPDLTVDRGTLRSFDMATARELLRAAVDDRIVEWRTSVNWLYELFRADADAGRRAYALLKDRDLPLTTEKQWIGLRPARDGIWLGDVDSQAPQPYRPAPADDRRWFLGAARAAALATETGAVRLPAARDDQPAFDDKLATACALIGGGTPWFADVRVTVNRVLEVAEALRMTVGATAVYLWSLTFLDAPGWPLRLGIAFARQGVPSPTSGAADPPGVDELVIGSAAVQAVNVYDPAAGQAMSGLGAVSVDFEALSPAARWLWSRDADGINPFRTRWSDVVAGVPTVAALIAPGEAASTPDERAPMFSADALATGLQELAPLFGMDGAVAAGVAVTGFDLAPPAAAAQGWPSSPTPPDGLFDPALRKALAVSPDDSADYYTERVPAISVAAAADFYRRDPDELAAELARAGIPVVPARPDWTALTEVLTMFPLVRGLIGDSGGMLYDDGALDIVPMLDELAGWLEFVGEKPLRAAAAILVRANLAGPRTRAFHDADLPPGPDTIRQAELLKGAKEGDWRALAATAAQADLTYAGAFALFSRFRLFFDSWTLPDELPPDLGNRRPTELTERFLRAFGAVPDGPDRATVAAVHVSVTGGVPVRSVLDEVAPLLGVAGLDLAALRAVAEISTEPLIFDDLLLLGTQQLEPPVANLKEAVRMCTPTARQPARLSERAAAWLRMRPALVVGQRGDETSGGTLVALRAPAAQNP